MNYLIINPYKNANHGIANYIDNLKEMLGTELSEVSILENTKNLSPIKFREHVRDYITAHYGFNEVIIEAPEAKASTLLLSNKYKVHIRLHCPLAIAQKYDEQEVNQVELSHELRVVSKATIVSSPSYGLLKEMSHELNRKDIFVYKNPILNRDYASPSKEKSYDVVFMGRYQPLKGSEELNQVLQLLPEHYNVLIFGNNCKAHKLPSNIKCNVTLKNEVKGEEKFELISQSKCLIQMSRFENCSMVVLESLSCYVPVVCWDVGGNSEIANRKVLHPVEYLNFEAFVNSINFFVDNRIKKKNFDQALSVINEDFRNGLKDMIDQLGNKVSGAYNPYLGFTYAHEKLSTVQQLVDITREHDKKIRVLGIAYSNEHVEELWAPIISHLSYDSRYICRRPKGFHTVFKHDPFPVENGHYTCFDWINDKDRLEKVILGFKPNLILFHNGLHPSYQETLQFIKSFKIPLLYSELGWFPQKDHVYFDKVGVNAQSYIASQGFEAFTGKVFEKNIEQPLQGEYALLALQLENDTNLIVSSPDYKKNLNILKYIKDQLSTVTKIMVKPHPLDKNVEAYKNFCSENNLMYSDDNIKECLQKAHSVIAVNSTVLLEALEYPCNIYHLGESILSNKKVAISCLGVNIKDVWLNSLVYHPNNRQAIIGAFKDRQINLLDIREGIEPSLLSINEFKALPKIDISSLIKREKTKKNKPVIGTMKPLLANKEKKDSSVVVHNNVIFKDDKKWVRKFNKLKKTPYLFFKDWVQKRLR